MTDWRAQIGCWKSKSTHLINNNFRENKQLKDDNSSMAKRIIYLKSNQAELINKVLEGASIDQIEELKDA